MHTGTDLLKTNTKIKHISARWYTFHYSTVWGCQPNQTAIWHQISWENIDTKDHLNRTTSQFAVNNTGGCFSETRCRVILVSIQIFKLQTPNILILFFEWTLALASIFSHHHTTGSMMLQCTANRLTVTLLLLQIVTTTTVSCVNIKMNY